MRTSAARPRAASCFANRGNGPDQVMQIVGNAGRWLGDRGFRGHSPRCSLRQELEDTAAGYKKLAGFDNRRL